VAKLGNELLEALDRAAASDPGMHGISMRAQLIVLRLEIEASVKIERRTVLIELGADTRSVDEDEIDLLCAGQQGTLDGSGRNALRAFFLDPLEFGKERARLDGYAQDYLILDDEPSDRLACRIRLRGEKAEQKRHEIPD
jgi:hypothetical protein